ncbi:MAG: retention module-containing protein, partial [Methylotenera sp.]
MALIGRVVAMTGVAYLITDNGAKRELQLGDQIQIGDTIQTLRGVEVDLELASGRVIHISAEQLVAFTEELSEVIAPSNLDSAINLATIDTVIKAIEEGKDVSEVLEETAAGSGGQSNSYGFGFVDLLRINDILNAFKFAYEYETGGRVDADTSVVNDSNALIIDQGNLGAGTVASINAPPVATPLAIGRDEGTGSYTGALTATDANGDTLTYSPTGVLPAGLVLNPDGSFTFDYSNPAYDYLAAGVPQVLVVPYLVSDGKGVTSSSTLTITVNGSNDVATLTSDSKALTETNSALSTGGT